jgi:flagellar motility protein MotE (MotC chaperone)
MTKKQNGGLPREKETWAIRGIEPETRTAATMAARRAGQTVGEWCNKALRDAATASLKAPSTPAFPIEDTLAELVRQMQADREERQRERDELTARVSAMEARGEAEQVSRPNGGGNFLGRLYGLLRGKDQPS